MVCAVAGALAGGGADTAAAADPADPAELERFRPHPVITEVLFNVPKGDAGDATRDGSRHPTGDEFVELLNPHDHPVNLAGYTITNRLTTYDPDTSRGVRFTFPDLTLEPGAAAVLFNGHDQRIPGPTGDADAPPPAPNPHFHHAWVFRIDPGSRNRAFSNAGDFVLLSAPDGEPIDAVWWGDCDPPPPERSLRVVEVDDDPDGSVRRPGPLADPEGPTDDDDAVATPGSVASGE